MPVYLIRHGQSEFNAVHSEGEADPMIFDAPLTQKGIDQARQAKQAVARLGIKRVIASPLTRAIQTALHIFEDRVPIEIQAGPRELLTHSCDVGSAPDQLRQQFPNLSFDHLEEIWWHRGPLNAVGVPVEPHAVFRDRIARFAADLRQITDRPVAIVGHGDTFRELTGYQMANCEIRRHVETP